MVTESLVAKIIGTFAGAILSLVFIPPQTIAGFFRRGAACIISGLVASPIVHSYFKWPETFDYWLASAALSAFCAWWMMGVIMAVVKKMADVKD